MTNLDDRLNRFRSRSVLRKIKEGKYIKPSPKIIALLVDDQVGRCAICEIEFTPTNNRPHVDHCHETNKVRGLLCRNCNAGLGFFKDDTRKLERAILYLQEKIKFR